MRALPPPPRGPEDPAGWARSAPYGAEGPQYARICIFHTQCHSVYPYTPAASSPFPKILALRVYLRQTMSTWGRPRLPRADRVYTLQTAMPMCTDVHTDAPPCVCTASPTMHSARCARRGGQPPHPP